MKQSDLKNILLVTSSNLASDPRLLKEVRALDKKGYKLTVVKSSFDNWTTEPERQLEQEFNNINWIILSASRKPFINWISATIVGELSNSLKKMFNGSNKLLSYSVNKRSFTIHQALKKIKPQFNLVMAHNPAAFWPAYHYAKKNKLQLGIDIEDYHPGETTDYAQAVNMLQLMQGTLPAANFITAASPLILAYTRTNVNDIKANCTVINNVFAKVDQPLFNEMLIHDNAPIRLFWFSQHIGLNRGVQDAILAINSINTFPVQLTLLGNCTDSVKTELISLLTNNAHQLIFKPPCHEKELLQIASKNHIGLALEPGFNLNNKIALSNKIFTYLLAGNVIIASDTDAQKLFIEQYPGTGFLYPVGNSQKLAEIIEALHNDIDKLQAVRKFNYLLSQQELNWETEQQKFLTLVENVLS